MPTLSGPEAVEIPAGSQHGDVFTLRKRGLPDLHSGRPGNELIQVVIEVPRKLNKKQEELLRELAATEEKEVQPAQEFSGKAGHILRRRWRQREIIRRVVAWASCP